MHELAICRSLLSEAGRVAAAHRAAAVTRLSVAIGPLSGVEAAQLARAFDIARRGTVAEGAVLEVERTPVVVWCDRCGVESPVEPNALLCGACGTWKVGLRSGDELVLKRVTLADAPARPSVSG